MSVKGTGDPQNPLYRVDAARQGHNEDEREGKRRKKVSYQGRTYAPGEEELPVQPPSPPKEKGGKAPTKGLYADQALLEQATRYLARFTSIEEKAAQVCFFLTEAFYDTEEQQRMEVLIQKWNMGGVLFSRGDFRRQSYLIERYNSLSKIPLLIGNDFLHGLSFYFQGEIPLASLQQMDDCRCGDLGKAVVIQNRHLGVHFQFDRARQVERSKVGEIVALTDTQARSFRNGILSARGVVGREKVGLRQTFIAQPTITAVPKEQPSILASLSYSDHVQEAFGLRTLHFIDFSTHTDEAFQAAIQEAFKGPYDVFLIKNESQLETLVNLIKEGKIKESELDKHLIKVLLIKLVTLKL